MLCRKFENSTSGLISPSSRYSLLILSARPPHVVPLALRGGAPLPTPNHPNRPLTPPPPPSTRIPLLIYSIEAARSQEAFCRNASTLSLYYLYRRAEYRAGLMARRQPNSQFPSSSRPRPYTPPPQLARSGSNVSNEPACVLISAAP